MLAGLGAMMPMIYYGTMDTSAGADLKGVTDSLTYLSEKMSEDYGGDGSIALIGTSDTHALSDYFLI